MAEISTNKDGGVVRYDSSDWMFGLTPYWDRGGTALRNFGNRGFTYTNGIDPYRFPGSCTPGPAATEVTNSSQVQTLAKGGVSFNQYAYITDGNTRLLQLDVTTSAFVSDANFPHTITPHGGHGSVVSEDAVLYYIGTTPYIFYSWNDDTDGDVGRLTPSGPTFDDDYMSTVPTTPGVLNKNYAHPMIVGDDGRLYIANGPDLASFTGTAYNSSALDLPTGYIITSMAKTQNYLVLFAVRSAETSSGLTGLERQECTAFFWDYVSSSFTYAIPIQANNINGAFSYKGTVGCFGAGLNAFSTTSRDSAMFIWNGGSSFDQIIQFNDGIPSYGGVETSANTVSFNAEGSIYQWGNPFGGDAALNKISQSSVGTSSGLLRVFDRTVWYISGGDGLEELDGYFDGAEFITPSLEIPMTPWDSARITKIKIYWASTGSESTKKFRLDLYYYFAGGSVATKFLDADTNANFSTTTEKDTLVTIVTVNADGTPLKKINSINIQGLYDTVGNTITPPIMRAIEVYYDYVKTA